MRAFDDNDRQVVTALRVLAVDQVEQARSGHPGLPLGAAPMAYALWSRFLRHDTADPTWPDRDRFVLSAGHGSALLYALLHLFGYELPLDELKRFRQWGSQTPGHPEHGLTPGVEVTTGPLGQGFAAAVGMALAERHLAERFNRPSLPVVDHRTWVLASDGDLMEGISHEAASLAGHLRLGKLVVLYDDNHITIEGSTDLTYSDDVGSRFAGYGWRVLHVDDGNDLDAIATALADAGSGQERPTLIRVRTHIGYGAPHKQDTAEAHGAPLGPEEAAATRMALGWELAEPFVIPSGITEHLRTVTAPRRAERQAWDELLANYRRQHPDLAGELDRRLRGELPPDALDGVPDFAGVSAMATREASGKVLNGLAPRLPELIGGSADLAPSNNTLIKGEEGVAPGRFAGRNLHFGVREHAMAAIANGLALHGGVRPFVATFLIFSDYLRPALRLAALQELPVVYVFTHDSVALGEDGPTHQPIEQLPALRVIPHLVVLRPADAHETAESWRVALERRSGPTALALTRQKLPVLTPPPPGAVARGAFVRAEAAGSVPDVVLLASGSEVVLALSVRERLEAKGVPTRVVSVPSLELFARQDAAYRRAVLGPPHALRVAIEMAHPQSWPRWVGDGGLIVGIERFGASAPGEEIARRLGFSVDEIAGRVLKRLAGRRPARCEGQVPPELEGVVAGRRTRLESQHAVERLAARDASLWGERRVAEVTRRLGWLDVASRTRETLPQLERLAAALAADGADTLFLLGMGGSSLAPRVLREVDGNPSGRELVVVDTTDPERVDEVLDSLDPRRAAVMPVSKSGTTTETAVLTEIFWQRLHVDLRERTGERFVAISEPGTPLAHLARERRFRTLLPHPVDVGGRFAALSAVGAFPAVWLGQDADALLVAGARALAGAAGQHAAVAIAALVDSVAPTNWGRLAWCASPSLKPLGSWAEQLVAESTGKEGRGILPVVLEQPPAPDTAWPGTLYLSPRLAGEDTAALDAALDALAMAGHPVVRWFLRCPALGEAFAVLELAVALAGLLLGINPFDEPDVARAKERARAALSEAHDKPLRPEADMTTAILQHLGAADRGGAVALLAYLPERPEVAEELTRLADGLASRLRLPVTAAFGPRYLHSTGQLHKGGPDRIVPVVLTCDPARDIEVPGRSFTLGRLRHAQAMGDVAALREAGRRVLHLHLGGDPLSRLRRAITELAG